METPFVQDKEFANGLLEDAASALREACGGQTFISEIPPENLNFVAARSGTSKTVLLDWADPTWNTLKKEGHFRKQFEGRCLPVFVILTICKVREENWV